MNEQAPTIGQAELTGYLASRGWQHEGSWRGAMVWTLGSSGRLLVPAHRDDTEYADDEELLVMALRKLAKLEDRPEREVLLDITEPAVDTPSFQLEPETPSGTIPLPQGLRALQGIHDLLRTAAQTVETGPRLLFTGPRSRQIDTFLGRVRLGTTRPGSYIFDARIPITQPPSRSTAISWNDELAGRDVMVTLHKALHATHAAATSFQSEAFDDHVEEGVSANLCAALAQLSSTRPFTITFGWARAEPANLSPAPLHFTEHMARAIATAGKELERVAKTGRATITGEVKTLHPDPGNEWRVKILGDLVSAGIRTRRSIWVVLSRGDYQRAFHAQQQDRLIRVTGQLDPNQQRLTLRPDPEGFEIL